MQMFLHFFRRLWMICSESCGYFIPKVVAVLFRKLWLFYSEDCGCFVPKDVFFSCLIADY